MQPEKVYARSSTAARLARREADRLAGERMAGRPASLARWQEIEHRAAELRRAAVALEPEAPGWGAWWDAGAALRRSLATGAPVDEAVVAAAQEALAVARGGTCLRRSLARVLDEMERMASRPDPIALALDALDRGDVEAAAAALRSARPAGSEGT